MVDESRRAKRTKVFSGKTKEGLKIIVEQEFRDNQTIVSIRTGVGTPVLADICDHGVYSNGTRWYIYSSPWHYSINKSNSGNLKRPVQRSAMREPMATLEVPRKGPARVHYTTRMDITHLVKRL